MTTADNQSQQWKVNLEVFEGPLDLLLHLINDLEIDIYDIPIADITHQYLAYIKQATVLELNIGGEYLVMAATLMAIKSQLLVPRNDEFEAVEDDYLLYEGEDPREHLMTLLIEYRKFKLIAEELKQREDERSVFISKPESDVSQYQQTIPLREDEVSLEDIRQTFIRVLNERALREPTPTKIERTEISVSDKMIDIAQQLSQIKGEVTFGKLLDTSHKTELVAVFLAILELIKDQTIEAVQSDIYGEITLKYIGSERRA